MRFTFTPALVLIKLKFRFLLLPFLAFLFFSQSGFCQQNIAVNLADAALKETALAKNTTTDDDLILMGLAKVWRNTGDGKYFKAIQAEIDTLFAPGGKDFDLKNKLRYGNSLLMLYQVSGQIKYFNLAQQVYQQMAKQKANEGFYTQASFLTAYAKITQKQAAFDTIARQLLLREATLILNQSKNEKDKNFSANLLAVHLSILTDVLDDFPTNHPQRTALLASLNRTADALIKYQNLSKTDSLTAIRATYALAKSSRNAWLGISANKAALNLFQSIKTWRPKDKTNLGALICAAAEAENINLPQSGKGLVITLDNFFNNEYTNGLNGQKVPFHYLWDEEDNNGFSFFGRIFNQAGAQTQTLKEAPNATNLKQSDVYLIVDPDTPKENPNPNLMNAQYAGAIAKWVKAGGVLVILLNDSGNCEINRFNTLPEQFGIHFNEDSRNKVVGKNFEQGAIKIAKGNKIFKTAKKVYIKEISTITVKSPTSAALVDGNDIIVATTKYGKGTVFAVGDPWFYNEYVDGRKLPTEYQNFNACRDLVKWIIQQVKKK